MPLGALIRGHWLSNWSTTVFHSQLLSEVIDSPIDQPTLCHCEPLSEFIDSLINLLVIRRSSQGSLTPWLTNKLCAISSSDQSSLTPQLTHLLFAFVLHLNLHALSLQTLCHWELSSELIYSRIDTQTSKALIEAHGLPTQPNKYLEIRSSRESSLTPQLTKQSLSIGSSYQSLLTPQLTI